MNKQEYDAAFDGKIPLSKDKLKAEKALELALDIRKFEIEMYWKRATYFWTFIAAAFAGYALVYARAQVQVDSSWILLVFSCLGFLFSVAWYFVNRGSKFWQNNWERHVDLLEDKVVGPLYKTIAHGAKNGNWLTASGEYSVSKINQILSFFVSLFWLGLIVKSLLPSTAAQLDTFKVGAVLVTIVAAICLYCFGRSDNDETTTKLRPRRVRIEP